MPITNKIFLQFSPKDEPQVERQISVQPQDDGVVINIRPNQQDSDDEEEHEENARVKRRQEKKHVEKVRSVSESSGDELASNSSNSSVIHSKGILKSRRARDFSRSMSESSADENSLSASCTDYHYDHYDSVHDINSESDCSSLKKTVRFNDVVSRQLFRYNKQYFTIIFLREKKIYKDSFAFVISQLLRLFQIISINLFV